MIFLSKRSYSLWWERKTESLISNISFIKDGVSQQTSRMAALRGVTKMLNFGVWTVSRVERRWRADSNSRGGGGKRQRLLYYILLVLQTRLIKIVYLLDQEWIIGLIYAGKSLEQTPKSDAVVKHQRRFVAYTNISHVHVVVLHHPTLPLFT